MRVSDLYRLARELNALALKASQDEGEASFTAAQITVLEAIASEKTIGMSELVRRTGLAQSFVSTMVDDLARSGFLTRQVDPLDRRRSLLAISAMGITATRQRAARSIEPALVASFPDLTSSERGRVLDLLTEISSVLERGRSIEGPGEGVS